MSLNKFQFIGNLTRDTDVRYTGNDTTLGIFDLAVTDEWRDGKGEKQEKTNFFRVKTWDKTAENAGKYLGKGSQVYVEGRIENTTFEKNGVTVYGMDFIAEQVQYLRTKPPASRQSDQPPGEGE
ncbi:Single-stranded DNA-binding protein [Paraburkholderia aspalathi]|uniref:Single-stranded DNA-binding protein n=1 Tax=Paraburkholderia aspalathi TaxID=1324617 RepID=A0ABM8SPQ6_9BURK|nr:single-stranded DNA-binding protein [Paraburkholderia aspalathi]MBK3822240.1 single-stranded DNA-binding protein [Paraburkholderia aspalathi]MBK3834100.1 single-stranded DNA-binding protein [Paraburkholderia aspalathi]MBK3863796.1 single-stranded DNA-binding protein [Paraburkholderia aspalathi]CAE6823705.1 Single-stranded DNA-binding protein [Paraburkholderia aspalathi]